MNRHPARQCSVATATPSQGCIGGRREGRIGEASHRDPLSRLPANDVLQRRIGYLLKRPVGRPPHEVRRYYASAASWPRSSGIRASSTRASASSSPT